MTEKKKIMKKKTTRRCRLKREKNEIKNTKTGKRNTKRKGKGKSPGK